MSKLLKKDTCGSGFQPRIIQLFKNKFRNTEGWYKWL